jgi:hypothetical protein
LPRHVTDLDDELNPFWICVSQPCWVIFLVASEASEESPPMDDFLAPLMFSLKLDNMACIKFTFSCLNFSAVAEKESLAVSAVALNDSQF